MRTFQPMLPLAMTAALAASACFYDPDRSRISKDTGTAGGETATDSESDGDGGAAWSGLGMICEPEGDDCAEYDADYCFGNPLSPGEPGLCTIKDCDESGCPDNYQCCDCSGVDLEIMCVPDAYVDQVALYCQCS